jgi:hypothetical protein
MSAPGQSTDTGEVAGGPSQLTSQRGPTSLDSTAFRCPGGAVERVGHRAHPAYGHPWPQQPGEYFAGGVADAVAGVERGGGAVHHIRLRGFSLA